MKAIKESDLKILFGANDIQQKIATLAEILNQKYNNEELYLICVLKGSVMFMVDLSKHLKMPLKMEFIRLSSYGSNFTTSGKVNAVDENQKILYKFVDFHNLLVDTANRRRIMNTTGIKKGDSISSRNCAMTEVAKMLKCR